MQLNSRTRSKSDPVRLRQAAEMVHTRFGHRWGSLLPCLGLFTFLRPEMSMRLLSSLFAGALGLAISTGSTA